MLCCQGIPSSPVQESNPPAQAPLSGPPEAPPLAEGEAHGRFSTLTCDLFVSECFFAEVTSALLSATSLFPHNAFMCDVCLWVERIFIIGTTADLSIN